MSSVSQAKAAYRREQWEETIQACQTSGKTIAVWCGEAGIKESSYYYWLHKIRSQLCEEIGSAGTAQEVVQIRPEGIGNGQTAAVIHRGEMQIEIRNGADAAAVTALMKALGLVC